LIPGRVRLHLSGWTASEQEWIESRLGRVQGVESVQANPLTENLLIRFDSRSTDERRLLMELQETLAGLFAAEQPASASSAKAAPGDAFRDPVQGGGFTTSTVLRAGVRGLLGHAAVDSLWFAAGFLGKSLGLPLLAGLGPLHVVLDIAVWGAALGSAAGPWSKRRR
jgi:hypothetical protein